MSAMPPAGTLPLAGSVMDSAPELLALRNAAAVRERCAIIHDWVANGRSQHFTLAQDRLEPVAAYVAEVTRKAYPDLVIPYHSRWRHFAAGGVDRWTETSRRLRGIDATERARIAVDLVTVSVLLDAGAGPAWSYREPGSRRVFSRSEGLAVASLDAFCAGTFSSDPAQPCRVDAVGLARLDGPALARSFQVTDANPLIGVAGRVELLHRLGRTMAARPVLFGRDVARPGSLVDGLMRGAQNGRISANAILNFVLEEFSTIWPAGLVAHGVAIGDAGRHPAIRTGDLSDGIVPFHKLSQWLTYSLLEPLEAAGIEITGLDELTALAEYRNGGLLLDLGVIRPRHPLDSGQRHAIGSELVVEWRALTVTLMDRLLPLVRQSLGVKPAALPLAKMLQGGTWAAGRQIAQALRPPRGDPPIALAADGTIF